MSQEEINFACSVLRKADSDTKKLAALLIIGKLFAQKELTEQDKSKLLKLIDCNFLLQLLNNHYRKISSPVDDVDTDTGFSLNIVLHFMSCVIQDFEQSELFFEILGQILIANFNAGNSFLYNQETTDNILSCFNCLNGCIGILSEYQTERIVQIIINYILKSYLLDKYDNLTLENSLVIFSQSLERKYFDSFLNKICRQFYSYQSLEKFKLCQLIKLILGRQNKCLTIDKSDWPQLIRDALFDIFKNKLNEQFRNNALDLATQMSLTFDELNWIKCGKWNEHNSKFFVLLLRLVCIEVQILLSNYDDAGRCDCNRVGTSLILFEQLLFAFINNLDEESVQENDKLSINNDTIISSIQAINEAMSKVVEFIKKVSQENKQKQLTGDLLRIVVASIRLICAYVLEESEALREDVIEVLPFILKLVKQNSNSEIESIKPHLIATVKCLNEDDSMRTIFTQLGINIMENEQ